MAKRPAPKLPARERIVRAAAELLSSEGREAVSTRAVSAAASVQAPAIYRQFGDMRGLLDAAAREVLAGYVRQKARRTSSDDPLEDLRFGWDEHVAFGLANPAAYAILYGGSTAQDDSPAAREGLAILERLVGRVAEAGRLRVSVANAARLVHAGGSGVTLALIRTDPAHRDLRLSDAMREAVIAAITVAPPKAARGAHRVAAHAVALRSVLGEAKGALSPGEQQLLAELLDRLAASS
jgi:AcrR family transcriptional regulator